MPFFNAFNSSLSIPRLRRVVPFSGIPRQGRGRRLYCYGQSFDTNDTRSNNGFYWQVTSDHPDWNDASGMTTDIAITSFVYHPSSTTYQIGDTLNAVEFPGLNASSAYHVFGGTDQDPSSPLYAPNGYYISGFTKDAATYSTRWSIDFDSSRGNWVTFWTQIFNTPFAESSFLTNVEGSPLITLYDSDGYFYSWTLESIDYLGNVLQDKFWIRAFSSTYTPSFSISPSTTSINEGESVTFTVTGVDGFLDYNTLYYEVSSADDFTPETATGSFSFSNNTGSFTVTSVADLTSEGTETFTAGVKTNSGSSPVSYSNSVTILDTSVSPPTDPEIWAYGENDSPSNGVGNTFQDMVVDSQGFKWHNDGSSLYQMHSNDTIEQWTSTIFYNGQFESKPYGSNSFPVGQFPGPQFDNSDSTFTLNAAGDAWCWNKDGSAFFVWVDYGGAADQKSYIDKYTLTSRFDISTASYTSRTEIEANTDSGRTVLNMNIDATDGSLLVITYSDLANDGLRKYTLSTPWDATTATLSQAETMTTGSRTVFGQTYYSWLSSGGAGYWDGTINACWWNADGTRMFVLFGQSGSITNVTSRTYILTERFDLSTSLHIGNAVSQTGVGNNLPHPLIVDESIDGAWHLGQGSDANGRTEGWSTAFWGAHQRPYNYSSSTYGTASLDFQGAQAKLAIAGLRIRNALTDHNFLEGTNFGISLWVKRTTLTDSLSNFIRLDGATTKLTLSINAFNKAQATFRSYNSGSSGSSGNRTVYNTSQLPDADGYINDTNWHHVVFCRDNGTYRLYVDGIESASLASGTIVAQSFVSQDLAEVLEIGGQNLRIADVHISQTDALYTGGNTFTVPTSQPSLLAGGASTLLLEANELDWNDKTGNIDNIPPLVPGNYGSTTDGTTVQQLITTNADMPY